MFEIFFIILEIISLIFKFIELKRKQPRGNVVVILIIIE